MHRHHQAKIQDFSHQTGYQKIPLIWLCTMANSVLGEQGELLEYQHLIANPKTWAT
jgi:hypothetical protein